MPISVGSTEGPGTGYADIRVGECQVHQVKLDVSALSGAVDEDGVLPPGLPLQIDGTPVGNGDDVYGLIGPEPVLMGDDDHFANLIIMGAVNQNMIEDNLDRALTSDEKAGFPGGLKLISAS